MPSFKLHIARIRNCPPPEKVEAALKEFGLPESEEYGVLNHSATETSVFATVARRHQQAVEKLDPETAEVTSQPVERVNIYPFAVRPADEVLEVYAGAASAIEQVGAFLAGCLAMPTIVEAIELDVLDAIARLAKNTQRFQLRSVRVSDYAHNAYMAGVYAPKFLDTQHGLEFLEEYGEFLTAASVKFVVPGGRAGANLAPTASFSYSCSEDDQPTVQSILRKLL